MAETIVGLFESLLTALSGGLIGGLAVKYYEVRKSRFEYRQNWIHSFRKKVEEFLIASEKFRLFLFWQNNPSYINGSDLERKKVDAIIENLLNIYGAGVRSQLMVRSKNEYINNPDKNLENENNYYELVIKTHGELDKLWAGLNGSGPTDSNVIGFQSEVQEKAIKVLSYNWNRIETGLDPLSNIKWKWALSMVVVGILCCVAFSITKYEFNKSDTSFKERMVDTRADSPIRQDQIYPSITVNNNSQNICTGDTTIVLHQTGLNGKKNNTINNKYEKNESVKQNLNQRACDSTKENNPRRN